MKGEKGLVYNLAHTNGVHCCTFLGSKQVCIFCFTHTDECQCYCVGTLARKQFGKWGGNVKFNIYIVQGALAHAEVVHHSCISWVFLFLQP